MDIIKIIKKHSLTIRCLPEITVSYVTYREGDEKRNWVDSKGNPTKDTREVFITKEGKKLLKITRKIEKGGWWYVKETKHTSSTIYFNRKYDKFFAPTLEEALQLYLDSIINKN